MSDATPLGRPVWYELLTTDMTAAGAFYSAVVGWNVAPFDGSPQPYHMFQRADGSPVAGVMDIPPGMGFPPHWEMYLAVPKLENAVAGIERRGGSALGPLVEIANVGRMRTMKDPHGAVFAIIEVASPSAQPEREPQDGDAAWHELYTTDAPAAMSFYQETFGWQPAGAFDMGAMGTYHMFGRAFPLGGMMNKPPEMAQVPAHWNIYFRVPDVDAGAGRVTANGGRVLNGPMDVPGGDRIVQCIDPQGAVFSLHQKPKPPS